MIGPYRTRTLVLTACAWLLSGALPASPLQGSEWKPLRIDDIGVPDETVAFVQFRSKGRLVGHGGCNRLFAEYDANAGNIFVGPVAASRMACAESVMQREVALAQALENARTYLRQQAQLVLFDAAGKPILEMRQTDWD
ncbi:MAG: META domain-containing protein [Chromatiaceae bacterium]|nr:META domain-containing protein [Gammaproteobacteria bacterium]MCP5304879.1 META domain-containing protein [Chromatiaceae bacterium]MCP5314838.1 META domain-containing protein [Chromatiaceae bacterium]